MEPAFRGGGAGFSRLWNGAARSAKGSLQSGTMTELLERELKRRRAGDDFGAMLQQLHSVTGDEMTEEEIQAEAIITSDEDLLVLKGYEGVPIPPRCRPRICPAPGDRTDQGRTRMR